MIRWGKLVLFAALVACVSAASAIGFTGLHVFGDSLSDSGNIALISVLGWHPSDLSRPCWRRRC